MITVRSLASGSSGNALLVRSPGMTLLVDCGLAPRELLAMLAAVDCSIAEIDALLVTHEHGDHTRGLPLLLRSAPPVIATAGTARALGIPSRLHVPVAPDRHLVLGSLSCLAIPVSHDAAEPCGYYIEMDGARLTVLTDLGKPAPERAETLASSDLILIEANHDLGMLRQGPYPARLKARVSSGRGHLSNQTCADWLANSLSGQAHPTEIWLAHLSRVNNRPELATATVLQALRDRDIRAAVQALPRRAAGPTWCSAGPARATPYEIPVQLNLGLS